MIDLTVLNPFLTFLIILGSIFGGGIAVYFIIKRQLLSVTNVALEVTQKELQVYKEKVERLEKDIETITANLKLISQENLALVSERDYLKALIISSITSRKDIHKELMDELKKQPLGGKVFRDGVDLVVKATKSK